MTRRVLVAVIVYDGRAFVPRALESIARLTTHSRTQVDVLVLDDASPDPGWSEELSTLCTSLGIGYYCSPRNLGIPRNMNLALLRAEAEGYDACVLLNSDVVVPLNLVDSLAAVADTSTTIASVTAWANDVSVYSLANTQAAEMLSSQDRLDAVSASLAEEFGATGIELPTGVGFCLYIPQRAIADVGLLDPVFGRGYAEEVDWCCRATNAGWHHVLAPSAFVFHMGSATNSAAGVLQKGMRTVVVNEAIVDHRFPDYRDRLAEWAGRDPLAPIRARALRRLVSDAARLRGVVVDATWLHRPGPGGAAVDDRVRVVVAPDGPVAVAVAHVDGWELVMTVGPEGVLHTIAGLLGVRAEEIRLLDRGAQAGRLTVEAVAGGVPLRSLARYPERV